MRTQHQSSPSGFSSHSQKLLNDTCQHLGVTPSETTVFSRTGLLQLGPLTFQVLGNKKQPLEPAWLIASRSRPTSLCQTRWSQALLRANSIAPFCGHWGFTTIGKDLGALYIALGADHRHPEGLSASFQGALQFWSDLLHGAEQQQSPLVIPTGYQRDDFTEPTAELEAPRSVHVLIAEALLELGLNEHDAQQAAQRGVCTLNDQPVSMTMAVDSQTLLLMSPLKVPDAGLAVLEHLLKLNSVIFPSMAILAAVSSAGFQLFSRWPLKPRHPVALARWLTSFAHYANDLCS